MPSPFYITTAINYTNGNPHIGHAYEVRQAVRQSPSVSGLVINI